MTYRSTQIETQFAAAQQEYGVAQNEWYVTSRWEVVMNDEQTLAIIKTDGRYPDPSLWFSVNTACTEEITILWWYSVLETPDGIVLLQKWDNYTVPLNTPYSMAGKVIARVTLTPAWDSAQNEFVSEV